MQLQAKVYETVGFNSEPMTGDVTVDISEDASADN